MFADFGEAVSLAFLATYSGNAVWWKKADLHYDSGIM
jgi:hypothetical protein